MFPIRSHRMSWKRHFDALGRAEPGAQESSMPAHGPMMAVVLLTSTGFRRSLAV